MRPYEGKRGERDFSVGGASLEMTREAERGPA